MTHSDENDAPVACDHGGNYRSGDDWHCLTCAHVWPVSSDPEGYGLTRVMPPACPHAHVESWRKFGGTLLWRCLDCGADSRDDTTVIPPEKEE